MIRRSVPAALAFAGVFFLGVSPVSAAGLFYNNPSNLNMLQCQSVPASPTISSTGTTQDVGTDMVGQVTGTSVFGGTGSGAPLPPGGGPIPEQFRFVGTGNTPGSPVITAITTSTGPASSLKLRDVTANTGLGQNTINLLGTTLRTKKHYGSNYSPIVYAYPGNVVEYNFTVADLLQQSPGAYPNHLAAWTVQANFKSSAFSGSSGLQGYQNYVPVACLPAFQAASSANITNNGLGSVSGLKSNAAAGRIGLSPTFKQADIPQGDVGQGYSTGTVTIPTTASPSAGSFSYVGLWMNEWQNLGGTIYQDQTTGQSNVVVVDVLPQNVLAAGFTPINTTNAANSQIFNSQTSTSVRAGKPLTIYMSSQQIAHFPGMGGNAPDIQVVDPSTGANLCTPGTVGGTTQPAFAAPAGTGAPMAYQGSWDSTTCQLDTSSFAPGTHTVDVTATWWYGETTANEFNGQNGYQASHSWNEAIVPLTITVSAPPHVSTVSATGNLFFDCYFPSKSWTAGGPWPKIVPSCNPNASLGDVVHAHLVLDQNAVPQSVLYSAWTPPSGYTQLVDVGYTINQAELSFRTIPSGPGNGSDTDTIKYYQYYSKHDPSTQDLPQQMTPEPVQTSYSPSERTNNVYLGLFNQVPYTNAAVTAPALFKQYVTGPEALVTPYNRPATSGVVATSKFLEDFSGWNGGPTGTWQYVLQAKFAGDAYAVWENPNVPVSQYTTYSCGSAKHPHTCYTWYHFSVPQYVTSPAIPMTGSATGWLQIYGSERTILPTFRNGN